MQGPRVDLPTFVQEAATWFAAHAERRRPSSELRWGEGSDSVAVFPDLSFDEERAVLDDARAWQRLKSDAGFGSISWPVEYGGGGLPEAYEAAFRAVEREFVAPRAHEALHASLNIVAPTVLALGSDAQKQRHVASLRRADEMCCQLFSEPAAGSDLGALATRAERDGDEWVVNGQKVWTTGARFAELGYLLARTDPTAPRQAGLTAFVITMDSPGIEVRPLRQMTGGASFNEVFLTDVRIPDRARLGDVGSGWGTAMTALAFERVAGAGGGGAGGGFDRLVLLARRLGRDRDPVVRQELARAYVASRVRSFTNRRAAERMRAGGVPGAEGSIGKLAYSNGLTHLAHVAALLLGPSLAADTGEWGTFGWSELVNGAPGMRLAGGTDEIQRNTIAERVLGLPREAR